MKHSLCPHHFEFNLPLSPLNEGETTLLMDGKPMPLVTALMVKAGVDGFTNVCVEFLAPAVIKFVGHLAVGLEVSEEEEAALFGGVLDQVASAYPGVALNDLDKISFVKDILCLLLMRINANEDAT